MSAFPTTVALAKGAAAAAPILARARSALGLARRTGWPLTFVAVVLGWQTALFLALEWGAADLVAYAGVHVAGCGAPRTFVDWTSYEVPAAYPSESAAYRPNSTTPPMEICVAMYTES